MSDLRESIDKIHTTDLGKVRIRKNLSLDPSVDPVKHCKEGVANLSSTIERKGKNFYVTTDKEVITINASKLSIITAHLKKEN